MSKSYDTIKNKEQLKEIKSTLDSKKGDLSRLEQQKNELLNAITELPGLKLDEQTSRIINDSLKQALEKNKEKGSELSDSISNDLKSLEEIKQDTQEGIKDASKEQSNIERKQKMLEHFKINSVLDKASSELQRSISELTEISDDSINTMRELEKIAQKAGHL